MIQLARPWIETCDCDAVSKVLWSGNLVQGTEVAAFEQIIADMVGAKHAIGVSSGTAALHLALLALGVGRGDTVLVPAYSFPATANVVRLCGARLRFVDVEPDTFCMNPAALIDALEELEPGVVDSPRGRIVVMPVHAFGQCAAMEDVSSAAYEHGAQVVEDAACALGARRNGVAAGMWGALGCFSFHPRKILTTGEGGAVVTNDDGLAESIRLLRNHGMSRSKRGTQFVMPGFNYRMTDVEAALGLSQARRFGAMLDERRAAAEYYDNGLSGTFVRAPTVAAGNTHTYQSYVAILPEKLVSKRQALFAAAREKGIELGLGTYHIPDEEAFRDSASSCPVSKTVADASVSLPLYHGLTRAEQDQVVNCLLTFVEHS